MNFKYETEIDLKDLLIYWLCHWKSLCVGLVICLALGGGFFAYKSNSVEQQNAEAALAVTNAENTLTTTEKAAVDETLDIYHKYEQLCAVYDEMLDMDSVLEASEILSNIIVVKNDVDGKRNSFNTKQLAYFYEQIGVEYQAVSPEVTALGRVLLVAILIAVFLHLMICFCVYAAKNTVRHYENYEAMIGASELTRVIDWDGLSPINKWNFNSFNKIAQDDAIAINIKAIEQIAKAKSYETVAIVNIDTEVGEKFSDVKAVETTVLSGILYDTEGAAKVAECDAAVLVVRVGQTVRQHVIDEAEALRLRNINILGIIVFE